MLETKRGCQLDNLRQVQNISTLKAEIFFGHLFLLVQNRVWTGLDGAQFVGLSVRFETAGFREREGMGSLED